MSITSRLMGRLGGWRRRMVLLPALLTACVAMADQLSLKRLPSQPRLPIASLCVQDGPNAVSVQAEQATTTEQHRMGLMGRRSLAQDAGMLFVYERQRGQETAFWMYNTPVPLDVAFLGPEGEIRAIRSMEPCLDSPANCPGYTAGVSYRSALEVNRGFFEQHQIGVGGTVTEAPAEDCASVRD